jgi:hypothetical protein
MSTDREIEDAKRKLKLIIIKRKLHAYSNREQVKKSIAQTGKVLKRVLKI